MIPKIIPHQFVSKSEKRLFLDFFRSFVYFLEQPESARDACISANRHPFLKGSTLDGS